MKSRELEQSYQTNKDSFHNYIDNIKKNSSWDIYTITNETLIKNQYASSFPVNYFKKEFKEKSKFFLFLKVVLIYYAKNIYLYLSYIVATTIYKIYYKKRVNVKPKTIIDIFGLVDKTIQNEKFEENYLIGLYEVFEKYNKDYTILIRPYFSAKNPFKLKKFFKIINKDNSDSLFEYEFLSIIDFIKLLGLILVYPFKTLRLLQKEKTLEDKIFNNSLISDLGSYNLNSFCRYILGKNISKIQSIEEIYSWCEFQVVERGFNYAIRKNSNSIKIVGLQPFLNYETYFNSIVDELDFEMLSSPNIVLVNGKYYIQNREKVKYSLFVSLRYKNIFTFSGIKEEKNILLLGSYIEKDTKNMINSVKNFKNVIFKNHPAIDIKRFGELPKNIKIVDDNIYSLFEYAKIVIGTASGTSTEAVACGVSVIIVASSDNLIANPLVEYGKGKIWDIVYELDEIQSVYNRLIEYRLNNIEEVKKIANWYKENFFVEPSEQNIVDVFNLK